MNDAILKSYLDGWALTCDSTPESIAAMLAGADPEVRFTDINSDNVHTGHDGILKINAIASGKYEGVSLSYADLLCDGSNWSIRWTLTGPRPDGSKFTRRGASAGRLGPDGRVVEHTDYWHRAEIQPEG